MPRDAFLPRASRSRSSRVVSIGIIIIIIIIPVILFLFHVFVPPRVAVLGGLDCRIDDAETTGKAPLVVSFHLSASSDGTIVKWQFDATGDGVPEYEGGKNIPPVVTYMYTSPGSYQAEFTVWDSMGRVINAVSPVVVS